MFSPCLGTLLDEGQAGNLKDAAYPVQSMFGHAGA